MCFNYRLKTSESLKETDQNFKYIVRSKCPESEETCHKKNQTKPNPKFQTLVLMFNRVSRKI